MRKWIFRFRYDLAAMVLMLIAIVAYLAPIYEPGQIVFSDIAFGATSHRYLEEIMGVWNERWSTSTLFNAPVSCIFCRSMGCPCYLMRAGRYY